jgi:cell wall-associated NlpC family hydrolase
MNNDRHADPLRDARDDPRARSAGARAAWMRSAAAAYADSFRRELLRQYGWTDFSADVDLARGSIVVRANATLASIGRRFAHGLRHALGSRDGLALSWTTADSRAPWRVLRAPRTQLWRDAAATTPATELLAGDGPLQLLARAGGALLVRAGDGSAGWMFDPLALGAAVPPTPAPDALHRAPPRAIAGAWSDAARSYLGVPYRSGGTTRDGVDCSGLVQRLYRDVAGTTIPRHSRDQFGLAGLRSGARREGQLLFIRGGRDGGGESPFHVGVLVRGRNAGDWNVVHASSSRGAVVEDACDDYLARGGTLANGAPRR